MLFIVSGLGHVGHRLFFHLKWACTHKQSSKRGCSLAEPACQRTNGLCGEAPCQSWWSSEDTRAHGWPTSPDWGWQDPDNTDSPSNGSNRDQTGEPPTLPNKPVSVWVYAAQTPFCLSYTGFIFFFLTNCVPLYIFSTDNKSAWCGGNVLEHEEAESLHCPRDWLFSKITAKGVYRV